MLRYVQRCTDRAQTVTLLSNVPECTMKQKASAEAIQLQELDVQGYNGSAPPGIQSCILRVTRPVTITLHCLANNKDTAEKAALRPEVRTAVMTTNRNIRHTTVVTFPPGPDARGRSRRQPPLFSLGARRGRTNRKRTPAGFKRHLDAPPALLSSLILIQGGR